MRLHPRWGRLLLLVATALLYEGLARLQIRPFFFPPLEKIATELWAGWQTGLLTRHLVTSGLEIGVSVLLAAAVGLPLGLIIGSSPTLVSLVEPVLLAVFSTPLIILYPLLVVRLGLGSTSKIIFGALYAFFPIILNAIAGMRAVDRDWLVASLSMGARPLDLVIKVRLPAALPGITAGLRLGLGLAVIGVLATEYLAGVRGVGYLLQETAARFNVAYLYALTVLVIALVVVLNTGATRLEARFSHWRSEL